MNGLIPDRIEFCNSIDVRQCPDVQNFITEKEKQEDFLLWARRDITAKLVGELPHYGKPDVFSLRRFVKSFAP